METICGTTLNLSGIRSFANGACYRKIPIHIHKCDAIRLREFHHGTPSAWGRTRKLQKLSLNGRSATTPILHAGRSELLHSNDDHSESFWLSKIQEAVWATRSLFLFLMEQPSQLRYIEWPSFQSTLKTAMLTLVLVALLIVALSSVDSALSYLLALVLKRKT